MKAVAGLFSSVAGVVESAGKCEQCGATTRLGEGVCVRCLLEEGLEVDGEGSAKVFKSVLRAANVPDTQWRLGNYEILEEIGRGGMGVIYRARQRHSRRIVALKRVLTYHADSHETLARFRREAEAVASLDHPNILPIHEVSETEDGLPFFSMKLAAGGSLRTVASALRGKTRECVPLMAKVARAIAYAHAQGILHRDLQPGNILLDARGEPLVSDFGLAKWLDEESELTRTLTTFGTPGYIAPEQAEGANFGPAADIYSLGAILFNLLAGRPPFVGANALSVIRQAAATPAPKLRSVAPALDRDLETICARCLEREPQARYHSAGDLAADLERWLEGRPIIARRVSPLVRAWRWAKRNRKLAAATAAASCCAIAAAFLFFSHNRLPPQSSLSETIRSVAVLPLKNLTDNPENEYLTDGLTEALISGLSKTEGLKVISRGSVFTFKGKDIDPREVGRQLGVMTIVEGGLLKSEGAARVSVQLVSTRDGRVLWSGESFGHSLSNVFVLENELVRGVAAAIRPKLGSEQESRITKRYTESPEAYRLYLKGRYFWSERTGPDLERAINYFEQAIHVDPAYALAYSALADCYAILSYFSNHPFEETFPKAKALAEKALEIDSGLAEPHAALGFVLHSYYWDWARAENEYKRAMELNPNYATAHHWHGWYLINLGRREESIQEMKRALELDPVSIDINVDLAFVLIDAYRPDEATKYLRAALEMNANFIEIYLGLGRVHQQKADFEQSIADFEKARELSQDRPDVLSELGNAYAIAGNTAMAMDIVARLKAMPTQNNVSSYYLAKVYVGLNEKEEALTALEKASQARCRSIIGLAAEPIWDPLRNEPRFKEILMSTGLTP